ncbi:pyridoxal phosphate-dependent decarboxylase family protein [Dongia sp.]|uniref:pyridoxal phosphate-dependent decarboxylase family protein n=1 Tax=Dongia sp. TaxID=1977262 RepID=UPI00375133A0
MQNTAVAQLFARAAEHAVEFRAGLPKRPQRPLQTYAQALAGFDAPTPEAGTEAQIVLEDLVARAEPGLHAMAGPRFFGWVIGNSHPMGVAADFLTSAWGQNAGNHTATPAAAACETVAMRWLLDILDLPRESSVGFVSGATMAGFVGLAAARSELLRRLGWDVEADGLFGAPPITVLIGAEAHITVFTALQYLGLGRQRVIRIPVDGQGRMLPDAFALAMRNAMQDPAVIVVTQAGQLNTGAFDPHRAIIAEARRHKNVWVHVDGAFGLWARACPMRAPLAEGVELADSWSTDGHKWLQTPYDCGFAIMRDAEAHRRAMTIAASYLPPVAAGERDPSHFVPELSRRARGFAVWAMLKHLGRDGVAAMVERHCRYAALLAEKLRDEKDKGIAVLNDVVLNQVIVRFGADRAPEAGDAATAETIAAIQRDGTCFAGGAQWQGRMVMRLSVIGASTSENDVLHSAEAIIKAWRGVHAAA